MGGGGGVQSKNSRNISFVCVCWCCSFLSILHNKGRDQSYERTTQAYSTHRCGVVSGHLSPEKHFLNDVVNREIQQRESEIEKQQVSRMFSSREKMLCI